MQSYFVYENFGRDRGRVHEAECKFCNHGKGRETAIDGARYGKWHGPFFERDKAFKEAEKLGREDMMGCGSCGP